MENLKELENKYKNGVLIKFYDEDKTSVIYFNKILNHLKYYGLEDLKNLLDIMNKYEDICCGVDK